MGHPLHPAVVHFPVAGWSAALVTDVLYLALGDPAWWNLSRWLLVIGCVTALGAMTAGFTDFVALPSGGPASRRALRHLSLMSAAWTLYAVDLLVRLLGSPGAPSLLLAAGGVALTAAGFAALLAGAHVGAQLVYDLGVGQTGKKSG